MIEITLKSYLNLIVCKCYFVFCFVLKFILRSQVMDLYRDFLRTISPIHDVKSKNELRQWIRQDFQLNKNIQDEVKFVIV